MRHNDYNREFNFVHEPEEFSKYSKENFSVIALVQQCYIPGTKKFIDKILNKEMPGLTTIVFCFEDACLRRCCRSRN